MPFKRSEDRQKYSRSHYLQNREKYIRYAAEARERDKAEGGHRLRGWNRARRTKVREFINALKDTPCKDCGIKYPSYIMDFDHVRGEKIFSLGRAIAMKVTMEEILAEAEKCDVVCANCHRERTYGPK